MQLRLVLAMVIVVGSTLCGKSIAHAAERRYRLLFRLLDALRLLRVRIVQSCVPLDDALLSSGISLFSRIAGELDAADSVFDAWRSVKVRSCRRGGEGDCLATREIEALDRFFEQLGESGRAAQDEAIRACIAALELARDEAREQASSTGRLYTSIGFLTGLAIAVLIV